MWVLLRRPNVAARDAGEAHDESRVIGPGRRVKRAGDHALQPYGRAGIRLGVALAQREELREPLAETGQQPPQFFVFVGLEEPGGRHSGAIVVRDRPVESALQGVEGRGDGGDDVGHE